MDKIISTLIEDVNIYLTHIEEKHKHDYYQTTELAIKFLRHQLNEVKNKYEGNSVLTEEQEIAYFKNIKCHLLALLNYYSSIQVIELNKPTKSPKKLKKYYLNELAAVKEKIAKHRKWYNYYKSQSHGLDHLLFKRPSNHSFVRLGDVIVEVDKHSTTGYVTIFAMIESLDYLRHYLKKRIKSFSLEQDNSTANSNSLTTLRWTASKVDLIELIYALHSSGVFNNGRADVKEIANFFQESFEIDLTAYNRYFVDIKNRKKNTTKFLDSLKDGLVKKINHSELQLFT